MMETKLTKEDWFEEGMACLGHKDYADAERAFRRTIELAPGDGAPWAMLGLARAEGGNRAGAIEAYRRALTLLPRCDLEKETRENLDKLLQQETTKPAPGQGPAPPAVKRIPAATISRGTKLQGITWRPRARHQITYIMVIGEFILDIVLGIVSTLNNMAFWADFYSRMHRTYSYDNGYIMIALWVILAIIGTMGIIGKMVSSLHIDQDGITWRPWYFFHHHPWSEVESIAADEHRPIVHLYKSDLAHSMILVQIRGQEPLKIKVYRFRDPVDPKTGKVQKIEDVLRTYWEAFKQRVTEIPLEKNEKI